MRILKRIFELVFIFILPLVFCFCSFKKEIINTYDENNNLLTTENNFTWDFPFNDFKDSNHYINKLDYNQYKITASSGRASLNNGIYTFNNVTAPSFTVATLFAMTLDVGHKYYINYTKVSEVGDLVRLFNNSTQTYLTSFVDDLSFYLTATTSRYDLNIALDNTKTYNGSFYFYYIDLTKMFGSGFEPDSFTDYESLIKYSDNTIESLELDYYSSSRISYNYEMNYTFWGMLFNDVLINTLKFNDVFVVRFASSYIVLVIFMVFSYHMLIWPLDLLFRILFFKERL